MAGLSYWTMSGRIGALNTAGRGIVSGNLSPSAEAIDTVGRVAISYEVVVDDLAFHVAIGVMFDLKLWALALS